MSLELSYQVINFLIEFYRVVSEVDLFLREMIRFQPDFTGFYRILSGFTGFYRVLPGFYRVFTEFH